MWTFLLGLVVGALFGVMIMALCIANRPEPQDKLVRRLSDKAQKAERKAIAEDDALGQARAEGMWEIVCDIRHGDC